MNEKIKNYIPSPEEITKAEEMMTPEQKAGSDIRTQFHFQEQDPFEDFIEQMDKNCERRPPTPQEREKMDARLMKLGELLGNSDVRWHLDGALNISLMKGEYIGVHKDVDLSVEEADLTKLDEQLGAHGYGLFLHYPVDSQNPRSKSILERVGPKKFTKTESAHLVIAAIDEVGKIRNDTALNYMDIHLIQRNIEGKQIGPHGIALPSRWAQLSRAAFKGYKINLCHPAEVAYFKLHDVRKYDRTDLMALAETGVLTLEDVGEIEQAFEQETKVQRTEAENILGTVAEKLSSLMSADEIFSVFSQEPAVAKRIKEIREPLKILAQKIEASDKSKDEVIRLAFETFNVETSAEEQRIKIEELKRWVEDDIKRKES